MRNNKVLLLVVVLILSIVMSFPCSAIAVEEPSIATKMSSELIMHMNSLEKGADVPIYLFTEDISEEIILETMRATKPEYYEVYNKAKFSDSLPEKIVINADVDLKNGGIIDVIPEIDDTTLQGAIEFKRALYKKAYKQSINDFLETSKIDSKNVMFTSGYSPMIIMNATKEEVLELCNNKAVVQIDLFVDATVVDELNIANQVTRADYVRDSYGNKGSGVKIGQIEADLPNKFHDDLISENITYNTDAVWGTSDHATKMARIMVGQDYGVAPSATLYATGFSNRVSFYEQVEWLLDRGVNIINMSSGMIIENGVANGTYDTASKWVDHIAPLHDVHFIKSAGNSYDEDDPETAYEERLITSPGMAYNAITVGGFYDKNTVKHSDDTLYELTSSRTAYNEATTSNRPEKPNIIAPAQSLSLDGVSGSGTSGATAQVSGAIAQLCSYKSALKTKQTAVGAIVAASSARKIGVGSGEKGYSFPTAEQIRGSVQISETQGAGKFDSQWARGIAYYGNHWSTTINAADFPYSKTITINASSNSLTRIAIFWLKRNSVTSDHVSTVNALFSNLDLRVYDPSNTLVGSSTTYYNNVEIVQFVPETTGTYTIKISKAESNSSTKEHVGIAVW